MSGFKENIQWKEYYQLDIRNSYRIGDRIVLYFVNFYFLLFLLFYIKSNGVVTLWLKFYMKIWINKTIPRKLGAYEILYFFYFLQTHTNTHTELETWKIDLEAKANNHLVGLYPRGLDQDSFYPPEFWPPQRPKKDTSTIPKGTLTKMEGMSHTPSRSHWGSGSCCLFHPLWALAHNPCPCSFKSQGDKTLNYFSFLSVSSLLLLSYSVHTPSKSLFSFNPLRMLFLKDNIINTLG